VGEAKYEFIGSGCEPREALMRQHSRRRGNSAGGIARWGGLGLSVALALLAAGLTARSRATKRRCRSALDDHEIGVIKQVIETWAQSVVDEDYATWLSFFTDDAVLMPPGHHSMQGKAAIDAFVKKNVGPLPNFAFADWHFDGACGLAVVTSDWVAGAMKDKHHVVLRRQDDGRWLIETVIYNANPGS
jgi:ketosteroid isomerase-like protein